jgi:hypothetical protein
MNIGQVSPERRRSIEYASHDPAQTGGQASGRQLPAATRPAPHAPGTMNLGLKPTH